MTWREFPTGDVIHHDDSEDCICGPTIEPIPLSDGRIVWCVTHHKLAAKKAES